MFALASKLLSLRKTAVVAAVCLAVGAASGWHVKSRFEAAARAEAAERALKEKEDALAAQQRRHEIAIEELRQQHEALRARDDRAIQSAEARARQAENSLNQLRKEIATYVPSDEAGCSCNLTRGAVGLLNDARRAAAGEVSSTAGLSDGEKQAASTVTQRAEIEAHVECAVEYERLRGRHDALIDWLLNQP